MESAGLPSPHARAKLAFSLVELSIVLVILGLLVGGVLSGQALIKGSALKKDVNFIEQTRSMALTFREKYFMLPGDMNNASQFWGLIADCTTTGNVYDQVCNGNGDGKIAVTGTTTAQGDQLELNSFYHHLGRAGLYNVRIPYSHGNWPCYATLCMPKATSYKNSYGGSNNNGPYFFVFYAGDNQSTLGGTWGSGSSPSGLKNRQMHYIGISGDRDFPNTSSTDYGTFAPTEEVYALDVKYDDGFPMRGKILGHNIYGNSGVNACINSFVPSTATYVIDNTRCNIYFEAGF